MRDRVVKDRVLYRANVQMVLLCALTSFWVLVSPLVSYTFDTARVSGMTLFVVLHLLITAMLAVAGVWLNRLAAQGTRVTPATVRAALRRRRR